ncbi:MAG: PAS domain S-box protein, partial [Deltaproteobacteria bacterium]|nr:PAS domain S-box protein [Candidatus Tharpella aukensis]
MKIKKIVLLKLAKIVLLVVIGFSFFPCHLSAKETVRIGVLAHCGRERCLERWEPTTIFLNNQLKEYTFIVKPLDFDEIYPVVESGEVEFVLANPACYATIEARYGAQRIATIKHKDCSGQTCKTSFGGVIFCRSGRDDLKTLPQIVGKRFMAVHKNSFGGWLMAWRKLMENGIDPVKDCSSLEFGLTHDAVVKAVQEGRVDVGTVRSGTLERMSREGNIKLNDFQVLGQSPATPGFPLLHSTRLYPEWPLAKLAHTDGGLAEKVVATLLTLGDLDKKEKNLAGPTWTIPQNYQTVHECLKILRITPYEHYGEITFKAIFRAHWPAFTGLFLFIIVAFVVLTYIQRLRVKMQAQAALQQSRDFLQTVLDANPDPIIVISRDYKIILSNRAARKIPGGRRDGQFDAGTKCYEYFHDREHPCSGGDFQCPLSTKKRDHAVLIVERSYCDVDGNEHNYEVAIAPIIDKSGEDLGVVESFRNISKRKKAEKARQRLERAVEQSGETIVITDSEGTIQYVNPAFVRITGYSRDEATGQNPRVLKSGQHSLDFYQNMWKTLLAGETWQGEFINRKKDGSDYYEEATISPIFGDDNRITNFIAVKRDVTPLKRSQQALKESEEYHRNLFNDSPTPLFLQDFSLAADRVQELKAGGVDNLTDYLKQNPDEVKNLADLVKTLQMNKAARQLYNIDSSEQLQDALSRVLISGESQHFIDQIEVFVSGKDWYEGEGVNQNSDGNALHVVIKKVVINRSENGLSRVLVAINDVTKLHDMFQQKKELEEQLAQSQKMEAIGTLAGGIAHDFNNILTSILGFSELVLLDLPDGSNAKKDIAQVLTSGQRAKELVKQILTFSRK